jgi:PAS domain S-box-containing protein
MSNGAPQNPSIPLPANEAERLAALYRFQILDTPPEAAFDRITQLAARLFKVPIALISLVDESRAWFKSGVGFGASEVARDATLCSFAVLVDEPLIIPDARLDDRFACNPFVRQDAGIRFYGGAPLISRDGFNLGTLCLLDSQPRDPLTEEQVATLVDLAAMVVDELELRLAAAKLAQVDEALLKITRGVSTVTGGAFIEALVQHFAKVLDVDYVYVGLIETGLIETGLIETGLLETGSTSTPQMRTIATHAHGQIVENLQYLLHGTPCWEVIKQGKTCCYPNNVQTHFPNAALLQPLAIESYIAAPFFDSNGAAIGLVGVMDSKPLENAQLAELLLVTFASRVAAELERQQSAEDRDRFFQLSRDMLAIANMDGYFLQVNPAWTDTLGYRIEELSNQPYLEFVHPDDQEITQVAAATLAQGIPVVGFENRYRHQDGSYRWISWSCATFIEQKLLYCVARDVTALKQAAVEREQLLASEQSARETAERANRIKDEFLAVLSHELRSPLNPILGWTKLLLRGKLDPTRQTEALQTIERNAKLRAQLIEDLLDISRIMQGKLSFTTAAVSLTFVISAALETVRLAAEAKNIPIRLDFDTPIAPVSGDAARLQQVVWNLLTNAVKFTPSGGTVTVELRQIDRQVQLCVRDTGKGIHPQFLPHVFDYFRQEDSSTTRNFGGLGLGLAIVRQIIEMHGGTVTAASAGENQGATFTVQLPAMPQVSLDPSESLNSAPDDRQTSLANLQILVVDDEADTRDFQAFVLEQSGAIITAVASGFEALQKLDQFVPDLLVSDVGMADMDGYMLIQQIRSRSTAQGGDVPAIALTAYARDLDQQKALQLGFQAHLTKPVDPEALIETVIHLLHRKVAV